MGLIAAHKGVDDEVREGAVCLPVSRGFVAHPWRHDGVAPGHDRPPECHQVLPDLGPEGLVSAAQEGGQIPAAASERSAAATSGENSASSGTGCHDAAAVKVIDLLLLLICHKIRIIYRVLWHVMSLWSNSARSRRRNSFYCCCCCYYYYPIPIGGIQSKKQKTKTKQRWAWLMAFLGRSVGHQHLRPARSPKPSSRLPRHRRRRFHFDGNQSDDLAVAARPAMFAKRLFHKALHHHHQQVPPLGLRRFHLTFFDPTNHLPSSLA
jgi:hypothetical protein